MEQNNFDRMGRPGGSRIGAGLVLLAIGFLLLAYKMGAPIPHWLFTWPVILIVIGFFTGIKSGFRNPGAFILIIIGGIFFVDQSVPGIDFHNYIVPAILIGIGFAFLFRPRKRFCNHRRRWEIGRSNSFGPAGVSEAPNESASEQNATGSDQFSDSAEYININAVFGGIKKNITSKNFKGGQIVSFMGGSEINFMQADLQHPVTVEVNNVFGGTKLIIPSNWDVKNEISAVFGGVEDKRSFNTSIPDSSKKILLKGACVFGGIEVTNY